MKNNPESLTGIVVDCKDCGGDVVEGVTHHCPVTGSTVDLEMKYEGYHPIETLPIQRGDRVRIRKGTRILNRYSNAKPREYEAGRAYTVVVNHLLCGTGPTSWYPDTKVQNPKVCWAGPSGYWLEADINDVEKV